MKESDTYLDYSDGCSLIERPITKVVNRVGKEYNDFCIIVGEPKIAKDVWIGYFTLIDGSGGLEIGEGTQISSGVHIYTHDSIRSALNTLEKDYINYSHIDRASVSIGKNTFIGANSTILKGITIGDKCVIGANTLVNKDVPSFSLAIGNPMKLILDYSKEKNENTSS